MKRKPPTIEQMDKIFYFCIRIISIAVLLDIFIVIQSGNWLNIFDVDPWML